MQQNYKYKLQENCPVQHDICGRSKISLNVTCNCVTKLPDNKHGKFLSNLYCDKIANKLHEELPKVTGLYMSFKNNTPE